MNSAFDWEVDKEKRPSQESNKWNFSVTDRGAEWLRSWIRYRKWSDSVSRVQLFATPWNSPGKNTAVGSHCLLQRIFQTQESNRGLLHCRQILYQLRYQGSILRETQIKTRMRHCCSHTKMVQIEKTGITKCWGEWVATTGKNAKWYSHFEK